ncbi:hypothetical protein [Curtobacterium sp. C2H10]|uniref:hypothetical protein n=1 Tax=Curtobacterium sp. C2H10 TaxID=2736664 RepID=UPI0021C1DBED|nr:hypothetical protein [Curtobacterium sp. C2H10]MCT9622731.1 hypothetical protein [Curtobacterium sp. C2H10]
MITPEDLLVGPRGRRFCFELLGHAADESSAVAEHLYQLSFWAEYHLDRDRGNAPSLFGPGADRPEPAPSTFEVAHALEAVIDTVDPRSIDTTQVLRALADTADTAMSWQEPDATDVLLARSDFAPALARLASTWASLPAVTAVVEPPGAVTQWSTVFDGEHGRHPDRGAGPGAAARSLTAWHRALTTEVAAVRPRDRRRPAAANVSGSWWSTPPPELVTTTAAVGTLGPIGLWAVEDGLGWERATVAPIHPTPDVRVLLVDSAEDWGALCRRWSVDVSDTTRRHDWYRTTGRDGRWLTPDWSALAETHDAVHVTVRAWLRAAGTAIPVDPDTASVIAGWTPDTTVWLRDPQPVVDDDAATVWTFDGDVLRWTTGDDEVLTDGVFPTRS